MQNYDHMLKMVSGDVFIRGWSLAFLCILFEQRLHQFPLQPLMDMDSSKTCVHHVKHRRHPSLSLRRDTRTRRLCKFPSKLANLHVPFNYCERLHLLMSARDFPRNSACLEEPTPCDHFTVFSRDLVVCLTLSDGSRECLAIGCVPHVGDQKLDNRSSGCVPELSRLERRHWCLAGVREVIDGSWLRRNSPWGVSGTDITIPDKVREICE